MVSVQPEVNRVLHAINLHVTGLVAPWLSYNKYESQTVNTAPGEGFPYDLAWLRKDNYDNFLTDYIKDATLIEYIEDACFFTASAKLVHISEDINELLMSHQLVGIGLGNVIRGSYSNTVFLRVYGVQTLIVARDSIFFSLLQDKPLSRIPDSVTGNAMPRRYQGLAYELRHRYFVTWSEPDIAESCESVCARRGMACNMTGLWLLSTECAVLVSLVQACRSCTHDVISSSQIRTPVFDGLSYVCRIGSIHFLSCRVRSSLSNRAICACS